MKTSHLFRFAGILIALAVTTGTTFSASYRSSQNSGNAYCVSRIADLTSDQKSKINTLYENHQNAMDQLREKRRATSDLSQKAQVRTEMDNEIANYRSSVNALLTAEQQAQFNANQGSKAQRGSGKGKGNTSGKGKRNGSGKTCRQGSGVCRSL